MGQNCSNTDEVFERLTTNVCNLCNHLSGSQKYINRKALHQFSGCFYIPLDMAVADQKKWPSTAQHLPASLRPGAEKDEGLGVRQESEFGLTVFLF